MTEKINAERQRELLRLALAEQGCDCQDCRGYAWDRVNEMIKRENK